MANFLHFQSELKPFFQRLTFSKSEFSHFQVRLKAKSFCMKLMFLLTFETTDLNFGN